MLARLEGQVHRRSLHNVPVWPSESQKEIKRKSVVIKIIKWSFNSTAKSVHVMDDLQGEIGEGGRMREVLCQP